MTFLISTLFSRSVTQARILSVIFDFFLSLATSHSCFPQPQNNLMTFQVLCLYSNPSTFPYPTASTPVPALSSCTLTSAQLPNKSSLLTILIVIEVGMVYSLSRSFPCSEGFHGYPSPQNDPEFLVWHRSPTSSSSCSLHSARLTELPSQSFTILCTCRPLHLYQGALSTSFSL